MYQTSHHCHQLKNMCINHPTAATIKTLVYQSTIPLHAMYMYHQSEISVLTIPLLPVPPINNNTWSVSPIRNYSVLNHSTAAAANDKNIASGQQPGLHSFTRDMSGFITL